MKKVLIISYFFPPCNLTAANRIQGWADSLRNHGYYPIIVTRNWDRKIEGPEDVLHSSGASIEHQKYEGYEVYALPYKANLRDRIYVKHQGSPIQKLSRVLTFFNLIAENFNVRAIPHSNLYFFAKDYLKEHTDVKTVIISGNPFNQFSFGYHLNKNLGVDWIADYRDDWNTNGLVAPKKGLNAFIGKLQKKSEKKWVSSAKHFTSVSEHYVEKITDFTRVNGTTILNGYDGVEMVEAKPHETNFVITYNGSLYNSQPIEPFLNVIRKLLSEGYRELHINFPGLAFDAAQAQRVQGLIIGHEENFNITNRIPKNQIIQLQANSDLVLMLSYADLKGIPSSKLYEYIGLQKEVLLFPPDNDVIEADLTATNLGLICQDEEALYATLKMRIENKRNKIYNGLKPNLEVIRTYSRKAQTKKLAELLDKIAK